MRKIIKIVLFILQNFIIFIVVAAMSTSIEKHIQSNAIISDFTSKGVYQEDISTGTVKYYLVPGNETKKSIDFASKLPGVKGDILVSTEASLGIPLVSDFVSYFAGGHAALSTGVYRDYQIQATDKSTIEATGMNPGNNDSVIMYKSSSWVEDNYFNSVIGLRVAMSDEECDEVLSLTTSLVGDPYNYSFMFNTNKTSYCTDLISKAFKRVGYNLNKDGGTNSIYDFIVTNDTYMYYYHYFKDGIKYIYYLGWEE